MILRTHRIPVTPAIPETRKIPIIPATPVSSMDLVDQIINDKLHKMRYNRLSEHNSGNLFCSVPSMALILLVKVQSRVFTAKCSEPQVGTSNGMDEGSGVTKFLSLRTET